MWSDLGHFGINFVTKRNAVCSSCFSSVCRFTPDRESIESLSLVGTTHQMQSKSIDAKTHVFFLNNCMLDTLQQMNQVDTSTHTHSTLVKLSHHLGASLAVPLSNMFLLQDLGLTRLPRTSTGDSTARSSGFPSLRSLFLDLDASVLLLP